MRSLLIHLSVLSILAVVGVDEAVAQQRQLRSVTFTYRSTSITRTQWSPDSTNPDAASPGRTLSTTSPDSNSLVGGENGVPGSRAPAAKPTSPYTPGFSRSTNAGDPFNDLAHRPTNQQLQNPSGEFQLSHGGTSQPASVAPNNYFGAEFHSWNNLQTRSGNLDSFESFNRFQPAMDSGSYFSPNTYVGSGNNQWSNLSSSSLAPNELGGWNYWP